MTADLPEEPATSRPTHHHSSARLAARLVARSAARSAAQAHWLAILLAILVLSGCREGASPEPASGAGPTPATARPVEPGSQDGMPSAGRVRLRVDKGLVTLRANSAPRRVLIESLARELDFELVASDLGSEPISAQADAEPLRDVLPRLLPDRVYRVEHRIDALGRGHEVARLEIAPLGATGFASAAPGSSDEASASQPGPAEPETPATAAETPTGVARTDGSPGGEADEAHDEEHDWKELLRRLDDSDPDERIEALAEIDPDGEGLPLITDRLARDPDPRVRVAAAEQLDLADSLQEVDALLEALKDPHRDVVLAAIESLAMTDDPTVVPELQALLVHDDREIRLNATEVIQFLDPNDWD